MSYERIGDVLKDQGDPSEALKSYRDDLAIAERLAKSDPGNTAWQRDLSVSYLKLGDCFLQSGDTAQALHALSQGRDIILRMTQLTPDNALWRNDLVLFNNEIENLQK